MAAEPTGWGGNNRVQVLTVVEWIVIQVKLPWNILILKPGNIISEDMILYTFVVDYVKIPFYRRQG